MTVPQQSPRNVSTAAAGATVFPYDFRILADTDLQVQVNGVTKSLGVHYAVSGVGTEGGGQIVFTTAMAGGETVMRRRLMPLVRTNDFQYLGDLRSFTLNNDQDAPIMMLQQLEDDIGRSLKLPPSSTGTGDIAQLTPLAPLVVSADGQGVESGSTQLTGDMLLRPNLANGAQYGARLLSYAPSGGIPRPLQDLLSEQPVSVKSYGALGDGANNDSPGINAAINAAVARGVSTVFVPRGTYVIDTDILLKPGIRLLGEPGSVIIQRSGANLGTMIDFGYPSTADGATLEGLTIDGNAANNAVSLGSIFTVHVRTAARATIKSCVFQNTGGWFIATNGPFTKIQECEFFGSFMGCVFAFHGTPAPSDGYLLFENNLCRELGGGAVLLQASNYGVVRGNRVLGTTVGGRGNRVIVNTSGTTVTWVSGPNFASIRVGMWVVLNNGAEYKIMAKVSNTQLTVDSAMPTLTNTQAGLGTGDLVGNLYSSFCQVIDNVLYGGATYGCGGVIGGSAYQCSYNIWARNEISYSGKHAINVTYDGGAGFLDNNTIRDNKVFNPGNSGGISANDRIGIFIGSGAAGKVVNTFIDGNSVVSAGGDGQTEYWLGFDGLNSAASVFVGKNVKTGMAFSGIKNDILSIVLESGWGGTAAVSDIVSNGDSVTFKVTANGGGIGSQPGLTVNKVVGSPDQVPTIVSKIVTSTGAVPPTIGEQQSTQGAWRSVISATPASGAAYVFVMKA
ncbi:glycoside hydrolase family 55 protein [Xanthomonas sacchari]|uniref:glycoside hydrolase family 55 protein n=1 Tax=Xanthomonas sacchari TaxID=56458 RepID=UPI002254A23D|nr:glycoside hydrolase family 55 protein [Xanthomonas sacchari]MCW0370283.1 hypothetical protein [Xanthomonas sacchari]